MAKLSKLANILSPIKPNKTETYAGKHTARVTKTFLQGDGSVIRATRKINKDGSISDKIEHRHK